MSFPNHSLRGIGDFFRNAQKWDQSGRRGILVKKPAGDGRSLEWRIVDGKEMLLTPEQKQFEHAVLHRIEKSISTSTGREAQSIIKLALHTILKGDSSFDAHRTALEEEGLSPTQRKEVMAAIRTHIEDISQSYETAYDRFEQRFSRAEALRYIGDFSSCIPQTMVSEDVHTQADRDYYGADGLLHCYKQETGKSAGEFTLLDALVLNERVKKSRETFNHRIGGSGRQAVFAALDKLDAKSPLEDGTPILIVHPGNNDIRNGVQVARQINAILEWARSRGVRLSVQLCILGRGGHPTTAANFSFIRVASPDKRCEILKRAIEQEELAPEKLVEILREKADRLNLTPELERALKASEDPFDLLDILLVDDKLRALFPALGNVINTERGKVYLLEGVAEAETMAIMLQQRGGLEAGIIDRTAEASFTSEIQGDYVQVIEERDSLHTGMNVENLTRLIDRKGIVFCTSAHPQSYRQSATFERQLPPEKWSDIISLPVDVPLGHMAEAYTNHQLYVEALCYAAEAARSISYRMDSEFVSPRPFDRKMLLTLREFYMQLTGKTEEDMAHTTTKQILSDLIGWFNEFEHTIPYVGQREALVSSWETGVKREMALKGAVRRRLAMRPPKKVVETSSVFSTLGRVAVYAVGVLAAAGTAYLMSNNSQAVWGLLGY